MYKNIIKLISGDITKISEVEAIVNAANSSLEMGGGVCGAIFKAAGSELAQECKEIGGCNTGEAVITKGYNLPNKYIIHTVGPRYSTGENREAERLASAYYESLKLANEKGIRRIAFPSISTGIYRFPVDEGAKIALTTAIKFLDKNPSSFDLILWVLDEKTYIVYKEKYKKLLEI
ncbi:macro domain-containing protein [Fusobacterium nucleatum]|uniref:macro domain-containing protein n=1 Tax=Fusobacterium nucleatum TaxID=851 RepID=UPI001EED261A|nr:macro domain-containing protein [Fusobacterium nucleatum]MCG6843334.1 macro domain-containing protein [Fusobacterium nucleatum]